MTANLKSFATVRKRRGDVLNPAQYRSIIEAIKTTLDKYDLAGFNQAAKLILAHVLDFNDPHHDVAGINFVNAIVADVYAIYTGMTPNPFDATTFATQTATSLDFLELIRRIVMNRIVYNQAKNYDGSVNASFSAYLGKDWGTSTASPVNLTYTRPMIDEADFIQTGWNGNTLPIAAVTTADYLSTRTEELPVIFTTSADDISVKGDRTVINVFPLHLASNDLTIDIQIIGAPNGPTTLFSLMNGTDILKVILNNDQTVSAYINDIESTINTNPSTDGKIKIIIEQAGNLHLTTTAGLYHVKTEGGFYLNNKAPFTNVMLNTPLVDLIVPNPGLQSFTISYGYTLYSIIPGDHTVLLDDDGSYILDNDGSYIVTYGDPPTALDGFVLLTDSDGNYLIDSDGEYIMEEDVAKTMLTGN